MGKGTKVSFTAPKFLGIALWHLNHINQVRLFTKAAAKSENAVGFRIQTSPDKRISLVWLLKCLLKPSKDSPVIFPVFDLTAWHYRNDDFDILLRGIFEQLKLPGGFPDKELPQQVALKISEKMQQDNQHIALLFFDVDKKSKRYLDKLKQFWKYLNQEKKDINTECHLLMCWIDYQDSNDWRKDYTFYDQPISRWKSSMLLNLTLTEKFNQDKDLRIWLRSQNASIIDAEFDLKLLEGEQQFENTIERIWKESKEGEPLLLLKAIYKLCKLSWTTYEKKWQDFH